MEIFDKEVYYYKYCKSCKHKNDPEDSDPCHECLSNPCNEHSHKPVCWEEKIANERS